MNHFQNYDKALQQRRISKQIQQLSWSLNKVEQRFNIDKLTPDELPDLIKFYNQAFNELISISNEINEYENKNNTN